MPTRVLLVDDDQLTLKSCRAALELFWEVHISDRGSESLEILQRHGPFAVIITDLHMPEMNGLTVLAEAQRLAPDTVRLMLTGDDTPGTSIEATNVAGVFCFLKKPCPLETLIAVVQEAVDEHHRRVRERPAR